MRDSLVRSFDETIGNDFYSEEFSAVEEMASPPSTLSEIRRLVREWYGNLPVDVLVLNKKLQKAIMDFEALCDKGILDVQIFDQQRLGNGSAI